MSRDVPACLLPVGDAPIDDTDALAPLSPRGAKQPCFRHLKECTVQLKPLCLAVACLGLLGPAAFSQVSVAPSAPAVAAPARVSENYGKLPLSFEPNRGQTSNQVQWLARGPQYTLFLAGDDAVLELNALAPPARRGAAPSALSSSVLRMNLVGARPAAPAGENLQSGKSNYFTGNDPAGWQRDVPNYAQVRLKGVYPGIDLLYYGRQGQLEYDFVVAPGADPSAIRWGFDGGQATLAPDGAVLLAVSGSQQQVRLNPPVVYQTIDGVRQSVDARFVLDRNRQASFHLGAYDRSRQLVIDPTLLFLGALGSGQGNLQSQPYGMAVDAQGEIILTGDTRDVTFPTTTGAYQTACNNFSSLANKDLMRCPNLSSAFITKISADGTSLIFSTYLHGASGGEYGDAVAVDSNNDIVVLGATSSYDFPLTANAYQTLCQPQYNGATERQICDGYFSGGGTEYTINGPVLFVAKLDALGENLLYSSFFGGTATVTPQALALDSSDNIYFAGFVSNAWPQADLYPNSGNVQYPTTSTAFQQFGNNEQVASLSVLQIGASSSTLLYSTLYGSADTTDEYVGYDYPSALTVGPNGIAYMGGTTTSAGLPTLHAFKPHCSNNSPANYNMCETTTAWLAAFDTKLSGASSLAYATYVGGTETNAGTNNAENQVLGLLADKSNNLYVTGWTSNIDFPTTTGVYQTTCNHANNANACNASFLTKLNAAGALTWSTYYGGTNGNSQTDGDAIALDTRGWVYLYGYNNGYGWDLPMVNPVEAQNGSNFAFVATFSANASKLLFATPLFESCCSNYSANAIANNGLAIDSENNIYAAGYGNDAGKLVTTSGTYATPGTGPGWRGYFAKLSPVPSIPVITWKTPAAITFGTALTANQLNAQASVAGTFVYTPAAGTVLTAGSHTLSVTFTPTDTIDYSTATASVTLKVNQKVPHPDWTAPAAIAYGTALSAKQLDAYSAIPGSFAYTPSAGTVLSLGTHTLSAAFTPTDTVDYTTATVTTSITVDQAKPVITWKAPAAIGYGTALSATQLDAKASVAGAFVYTPAAGTVLTAGSHTLSVTFTPTDTTDYTSATATVTLKVNQKVPHPSWATPAAIPYGTPLSSKQLDAYSAIQGTFNYTPAAGTILSLGAHTLSATFTPTDTVDYTTATVNNSITVNQAKPVITWKVPEAITYGTALSATQLDAKASVAGTYAYAPAAGTVLTAGSHTLSVTFTPTDTTDYTSATATVTLKVNQKLPHPDWPSPAAITYGTALGAKQLDAYSAIPGKFVYNPAAGTVLNVGTHTLAATFTPTDTLDYATVNVNTTITVNSAP